MATPQKDTIYIDVDDEITAIIDKVQASNARVVALVLPKRAPVFQSIVNMKLLKRTATAAKKHIVLITSELNLLPLAGVVGLHIAKTLQSKPEIPEAPSVSDAPISVDEDGTISHEVAAVIAPQPVEDQEESIEVDNDEPDTEVSVADSGATKSEKDSKPALNKKLKIPNFNKFRVRLLLIITALVLLIVGWAFAYVVLPKAQIVITTNNTNVVSNLTVTGVANATEVNTEKLAIPLVKKEYKKSETQKITATGKKDEGTKATGKATLALTDCSKDQVSVPSGTILTSGEFIFVTQADVLLKSVKIGSSCQNSNFPDFSTAKVNVMAQNAGDSYNLSARSYTVTGLSNVSASGTAMTGGTSKIVTVVAQSDVDGARQKTLESNEASAKQELATQLKTDGYMPLADTFATADPLVTASPNVGDTANDVTVTVAVTYTMSGVKEEGVKQVLENDINKQIDTQKQTILSNGLDGAVITITNKAANGDVTFTLRSNASAGVQQDVDAIKKLVAGKKKGDIQSLLLDRPGIKDVTVSYSPFWIYSTPSSTSKITIQFQQ